MHQWHAAVVLEAWRFGRSWWTPQVHSGQATSRSPARLPTYGLPRSFLLKLEKAFITLIYGSSSRENAYLCTFQCLAGFIPLHCTFTSSPHMILRIQSEILLQFLNSFITIVQVHKAVP